MLAVPLTAEEMIVHPPARGNSGRGSRSGAWCCPRRLLVADLRLPCIGNVIASIGAFVLGASVLPFVWNVFRSYRYGRVVTVAGLRGLATRWSRPLRAELLWENGGRRLRPAPPTAPP
jgi:hypothetical protein